MELDLKNGIPDGMIVTYYENGQKKEQSNLLMASGLLGMKTVSLK